MQIHFCKNHPQEMASSRCYLCRQPICTNCRLTASHHYFCGRLCYLKYLLRGWRKSLLRLRVRFLSIASAVLVLALLVTINYYQGELQKLAAVQQSVINNRTAEADSLSEKNAGQQPAAGRRRSAENSFSLPLNLQPDWLVNIWNNGERVVSLVNQRESTVSFPVPLHKGKNCIRLLVLDNKRDVVRDEQYLIQRDVTPTVLPIEPVERGPMKKKRLALTFDGGADNHHSGQILSLLKDAGLRCTLFLTGRFMERYPETVRQMLADGHEIGNHSYSHPHLTTWIPAQGHATRPEVTPLLILTELQKTDSIFFVISGRHLAPYWRAPFGEYNRAILTWAAAAGYRHIRWTQGFDTFDWVNDSSSSLYRTPEELLRLLLNKADTLPNGLNGVIVLMHLGSQRIDHHLFEILPELIASLRQRGYTLVTISQLLQPPA